MTIMSTRRMMLKDQITTGDITGANTGRLNPEQSNQFIDYMVDNSKFLKDIRTIRMTGPEYDLDFIGILSRIIRKGVEVTDPTYQPGINTSRKRLSTTEIILPQDISLTFLEDNIERGNAEDHVARLLAAQFANDICDLSINGDSAATSGDDKDFLVIGDGFVKLAKTSTLTHKFNTGGSQDYKGVVFKGMLNAMPNQFKANKGTLRFYCSPSVAEEYVDQLTARPTAWGDTLIQSGNLPLYKGVSVFPVEYFPDDVLILTARENLAVGLQRNFTSAREFKPRKRLVEYTMTNRLDPGKIVHDDALVVAYNIS